MQLLKFQDYIKWLGNKFSMQFHKITLTYFFYGAKGRHHKIDGNLEIE